MNRTVNADQPGSDGTGEPAATRAIRVLVVDDHPLIRKGIVASLATAEDIDVVAEAADGEEAEMLALQLRPHVILLDLGLPKRGGIETARAILKLLPDTHIIAVTALIDPDTLLQAVGAGAEGYITKDLPADRVVAAVRSVEAGDPPFCGRLTLEALRRAGAPCPQPAEPARLQDLTIRQMDVLRLISEGLSNKEIAGRLGLSQRTVVNHVSTILDKLGVRSRAGAAWVYAHDERNRT